MGLITWIFLVLKCFGLTAYSIKKTDSNHKLSFKRKAMDKILNLILFLILIVVTSDVTTCHGEINRTSFISARITKFIFSIYYVILIVTMNYKQTQLVEIFSKIRELQHNTSSILNQKTSISKMSKTVKFYLWKIWFSFMVLVFTNGYFMVIYNYLHIMCFVKGLIIWIITLHLEMLIFYYVVTTRDIVQNLNKSLKTMEWKDYSIREIRKKYQDFLELKKYIQNVTQSFLVIKLLYLISELSTTIYFALTMGQLISTNFLWILYTVGVYVYVIVELIYAIVITIYPFATFTKEVRSRDFDKFFY
jgi:hypothetical protein